jgi:fused signal recognition particle receptor
MEGGINPEIANAAIVAAVVLAVFLLFIYAIRRARKARARQIEEAGEDRPVARAKPKKPALRPEDVVEEEGRAPLPGAEEPPSDQKSEPTATQVTPDEQESERIPSSTLEGSPAQVAKRDATGAPVQAPSRPSATEPSPAAIAVPVEKPRPTESQARPKAKEKSALSPGLARTRAGWVNRLGQLFAGKREIDPALVEEIEKVLLTADIGVRTSQKLLGELRASLGKKELSDPEAVWSFLRKRSAEFLSIDAPAIDFGRTKPFVLLTIGVNGSGKTTTIGKLASKLKAEGRSVLLAAGDTFRAAATEQLEIWGTRVGVPVVRGKEGGDPSSVIFDGVRKAMAEGIDVVIADTAGRLHTKANLMEELQKVRRVVGKALEGAPHETWLVIDATSGQNAIAQAQIFTQAMSVTGIVLTKLDGTAKGGVILGIADQLSIPVRYIGVGERVEDLREFDAGEFVEALFEGAEAS